MPRGVLATQQSLVALKGAFILQRITKKLFEASITELMTSANPVIARKRNNRFSDFSF